MTPCQWCGKPTAREIEVVPAKRAIRDGAPVMLGMIMAPCCQACEHQMARHTAQYRAARAMTGYVNDAREQLSLDD